MKIENDNYYVDISPRGAQMIHFISKKNNFDYLWNGKEWPKHAPLLFPAIGRSNKESYIFKHELFKMPQHGFAADEKFKVIRKDDNAVTMCLESNRKTHELYPFNFSLKVRYQLVKSGILISFKVTNQGSSIMPFALGAHPAFNVPLDEQLKFNDYWIEFEGNQEKLQAYEIIKNPFPYRTGRVEEIKSESLHRVRLSHELFKKGLRIISNQDVKKLKLMSPDSKQSISISLNDFRNVCLWTKEEQNLPFLCIEPFNGLPDIYGEPVDWMKKEGNLFLNAKQSKIMEYAITLN